MASNAAKEIAMLRSKLAAYVREAEAKDRRIAELEAEVEPKPELWVPLNTAAIDCGVEYDTLRTWVRKGLVRSEKRAGRYDVEINSVREHMVFAGRATRSAG